MRVRVWISGSEGPSHDFELLSAPRQGERISIASGGHIEEGVVIAVSWQLQAIDGAGGDLGLQGETMGSVTLVHVICSPSAEVVRMTHAEEALDTDAVARDADAVA